MTGRTRWIGAKSASVFVSIDSEPEASDQARRDFCVSILVNPVYWVGKHQGTWETDVIVDGSAMTFDEFERTYAPWVPGNGPCCSGGPQWGHAMTCPSASA
jgi:hypothetical protein